MSEDILGLKDDDTVEKEIIASCLAKGIDQSVAQEIANTALAIMASVSSIFLEVDNVTSCPEARVYSLLFGGDLVASRIKVALDSANAILEKDDKNYGGTVH